MEKLVKREIEFRAWNFPTKTMFYDVQNGVVAQNEKDQYVLGVTLGTLAKDAGTALMQFTGLCDKNGKKIFEGDILQFSNKAEWYKSEWRFGKVELKEVLENHTKYPYERRLIQIPDCYEWLLSGEIQKYWENIGTIFENPELLES